MKKTKWMIGAVALAVVVVGGAAWWLLRAGTPDVQYRTAKLERGNLLATVSASGAVNPVTQVSVGTQVSGQIKDLLVDFNAEVKAGQLLAVIDPETFEYRVRSAQADVDAARAAVMTAQANAAASRAGVSRAQVDLTEAQRDMDRKLMLVEKQFIAQSEGDKARALVNTASESLKQMQAQTGVSNAQINSANANVAQREATLAQARIDLARTRITSPVTGIVIKRAIEKGQTVAASLQAPELFVIAKNLSDMQVDASIDESDVGRIKSGQKATFTVDAFPGQTFEGEVRQVRKAAQSVANVVTYVAVVGFNNVGDRLLPGMTANVRLITDTRENVLKVPNAALRVKLAGVEPAAAAPAAAASVDAINIGAGIARPLSEKAEKALKITPQASASAPTAGATAAAPAASVAPGNNPQTEFRNRLVAELAMTPAQVEKMDAIYLEARPKFAALRDLSAEERPKARERMTADIRARIGDLLSPEQKTKYAALQAQSAGRQATRGRIYLLGANGKPVAYNVRFGVTDGSNTELLIAPNSPEAGALIDGAQVITGTLTPGQSATPSPTTPGPRMAF